MKKNPHLQRLKCLAVVLLCALATTAFGQRSASFENELKVKMTDFFAAPNVANNSIKGPELGPSDASGSALVPTGFGGSGLNVFGGIGGAYPQVYSNSPDLSGGVGITAGNPFTFVNFAVSLNILDISEFNNFSGNFVVSTRVDGGSSVAAGATNIFPNHKLSDFAETSYYAVFSHSVQTLPSKTPGSSRLTYGIGIGTGRFRLKSEADIAAGKGRYGTMVFGNISYEIFQHVNLNAEWTGLNLGISTGIRPFKAPLNLSVGVANLTNNTADKPNMVFSLGYPLSLTK